MSRTLVCRPKVNDWKFVCKGKLRDIIDDNGKTELNSTDLKWLQGIADCDIEGAQELIDKIHEHEHIEIRIEG